MKDMVRILRADIIKTRHTTLASALFPLPLAVVAAYIAFHSLTASTADYDPGYVHVATLYQCVTWSFPLVLSGMCTLLVDQEFTAGNGFELLAGATPRPLRLLSKMAVIAGAAWFGLAVIGSGAYLCMAGSLGLAPAVDCP